MFKYKQGDYVQVVRTPDPWEGSGESLRDRETYLEHVGIVVEVEENFDVTGYEPYDLYYYDMLLVRFPCCIHDWEETHQRNIESFSLRLISRPYVELNQDLFGGHG